VAVMRHRFDAGDHTVVIGPTTMTVYNKCLVDCDIQEILDLGGGIPDRFAVSTNESE
jgi:hypothetical protein